MSSRSMRGLGPRQVVTSLLHGNDNRGSQSRGFRPLFENSAPEPGLTPATLTEPMVVEPPQPDLRSLEEEWAAKLEEVDQALRQARQQAESVARQAEAEGYQAGYDKGYAEGCDLARHSLDQETDSVRLIAESAIQGRQEMLQRMEGEIVALAMAIARKVIGEAAAERETVIVDMVRRAAARVIQSGPYRIRLNPQDAKILAERWQACDDLDGAEWELLPDERISAGGCVLECGAATVDARLETQLDLVQQVLMGTQSTDVSQEPDDASGH